MHRLVLALFLLGSASHLQAAPNIVFILADDLGVNDLRCYGRKDHNTPHLDRLARDGARFTAAYAACPVCSPTRAALMTGKSPARLHITTFLPGRPDCPSQMLLHPKINQQLPLEEKTLAEHLKDAKYTTGCFGKWHLGGKGFLPTDQGFDTYYPGSANTKPTGTEGGKGEFDLTAKAIEFIEANRAKPFFLYLAHNTPHIPYTAKPELIAKNSKAFEPTYAAVIESMDAAVGQLLAKLDELKLRENTIVVFTSDNGGLHVPELNHQRITHNTPYRAGKGFLYEGGIRVPLIVRWPGQIEPRAVDVPVITTDWLPTLLELTGGTAPKGLDGESFADVLTKKAERAPRALFWYLPHYTNQGGKPSAAIRRGDVKLIVHYDREEDDPLFELYDLARDPDESGNLSRAHTCRLPLVIEWDLHRMLDTWLKKSNVQGLEGNPKFDAALHRKLYIDTDPSKYNPLTATKAEFDRILEWRKAMDAVVPRK